MAVSVRSRLKRPENVTPASFGFAGVFRLLSMDPVSVGQTVDHDHAAVMEKAVDNSGGPEVVIEILTSVFPRYV